MRNGSLNSLTSLDMSTFVHVTAQNDRPENQGLADPVFVVLGGDESCMLIRSLSSQQSFQRLRDMEIARQVLRRTHEHQPILVVIDHNEETDRISQEILAELQSHLFVRILVLIKSVADCSRIPARINLPRTNPCLPIRYFQLPSEENSLEWEIVEFFDRADQLAETTRRLHRFSALNVRENRVACYIAKGLPNKKICKLIGVSEKTIEKCRKKTYEKLGVSSGPELASLVTFRNHFRWPDSVAYPSR